MFRKTSLIKISALVLSIVMMFSSVYLISGNADEGRTIYSNNLTDVKVGDTLHIPIYLKNNDGILGFKLNFSYDENVFEAVSVDNGAVFSGGLQDNIDGDATAGNFCVYWAGSESVSLNGIIFYINLKVKSLKTSGSDIGISYSQEDTFDDAFEDVVLNCSSINIAFDLSSATWFSSSLMLNKSATTFASFGSVTAGDTFYLSVKTGDSSNSGKDIKSYTSKISYDKDNITLLGYAYYSANTSNYILSSDYNVYDDGEIEFNVTNDNSIYTVKENNSSGVQTITDTAFTLAFKAKDNAMSGDYTLGYALSDYTGVDSVTAGGCKITVNPSSTSEVAAVSAESVAIDKDSTVALPIKISNNHGIMGYKLNFEYTASDIEVVSAECGESFSGTFNDSIGNERGKFSILWNATDNNFTNGTLVVLNIKCLASIKKQSILKISYTAADTFNEKYDDVSFNCSNVALKLNDSLVCQHTYFEQSRDALYFRRG